jgi:hypothetical protein
MKKMILLSFLFLFIPALLYGQDKVEVPVWNVGDKWILTEDVNILVSNPNESGYVVKYITGRSETILIYEKSSLNRLYVMDKEKRIPYEGRNKRLFNFPLEIGKSWTDKFKTKATTVGAQELTVVETFTPLGWEDIEVRAGKYKALKIEYKEERVTKKAHRETKEGKAWFWYSPDVKYLIKCKLEENPFWIGYNDWELASIKLK